MTSKNKKFKFFRQLESADCGPACLKMLCYFYGKNLELQYLREVCNTTRIGVNVASIQQGAKKIGFESLAFSITLEQLLTNDIPLPAILHWKDNHFVLLLEIIQKKSKRKYKIADPSYGIITLNETQFLKAWKIKKDEGILLAFEPNSNFYSVNNTSSNIKYSKKFDWLFFLKYGKKFAPSLVKVLIILVIVGGLNLSIPILTQKMVDQGINYGNINFVYLVLFSQIVVFIGITVLELLKGWLMLFVNTRISVTMVSDFLLKLFRLPIYYFDSKWAGDLINRIGDNSRVKQFLTSSLIGITFSVVNFVAFSFILFSYNPYILLIFSIGGLLSILWVVSFLKKREILDYNRFEVHSEDTGNLIETISGMPEIKLNNAEDLKRWEWERIQAKLFDVNQKELALDQYQYLGSSFVSQMANLLISFLAAKLVIDGEITLGMMLSISYIIGQMNGPLNQMIDFFQDGQDARISLARLREVHKKEDEDNEKKINLSLEKGKLKGFQFINVSQLAFSYSGFEDDLLFNNLNLTIPEGKVTAIVGLSGSGKTTLMKLLLKFYPLTSGSIRLGHEKLANISAESWRNQCGVVMQDGYIFSASIARNIALSSENIDEERVRFAARIANIHEFIEELPQHYKTKIGNTGVGLSKGQQQRLLIARAVYKNPSILFFDEATSSLDANNERIIHENLKGFFKEKTVLIIAHRLSTVMNADKIIVLQKGKIVETGSHKVLTKQKGIYFNLVKNQLELGV